LGNGLVRVGVDDGDGSALPGKFGGKDDGGCGFSGAAFRGGKNDGRHDDPLDKGLKGRANALSIMVPEVLTVSQQQTT
jgi:hypothetical protein